MRSGLVYKAALQYSMPVDRWMFALLGACCTQTSNSQMRELTKDQRLEGEC